MFLAWLMVVGLSAWVFANRLLPWLIARVLSLYLSRATVRLGSIGRRFEMFELQLDMKNIEINVANLRLTSSILSSEASNLVTVIATGVTVLVRESIKDTGVSDEVIGNVDNNSKSKNNKTLLLLAQFLGLQVRDVKVTVSHLPSLPDCHLVTQLGELRLDSSVIHRTKLSLALHLYQGSVALLHSTCGSLLEATFAFQANIQALVGAGKLTSVEEVNLDVDGLSVQLNSSLFQCILPVKKSTITTTGNSPSISKYSSYIPKAAQVKAECCSAVLEHTDKASQLTGKLQLLYICCKCTEVPRTGSLPDSHVTGQMSGLKVWANEDEAQSVLSLAKFQVLVQKEGNNLHSDTQIHELSGKYSSELAPWVAPVSWLVKTVEMRKKTEVSPPPSPSWLSTLSHQHQLDAWNSDLTVVDTERWCVSLHHVNVSSQPAVGLTPSTMSVSFRQARWARDVHPVLVVGQVDCRVCGRGKEQHKVDLMIMGTTFTYTPALMQLATNLKELVRPIMMQMGPSSRKNSSKPPSVAVLISQTKLAWSIEKEDMVLCLLMELRELEAAGTLASGEMTVSGLKLSQLAGGEESLVWVSLPGITMTRKDGDTRVTVSQRVRLAWQSSLHLLLLNCKEQVMQLASLLPTRSNNEASSSNKNTLGIVHITFSDKVTLTLYTGEHIVKLLLASFTAKYTGQESMSWLQSPKGRIKLNRKEVVSMDELVLSLVPKSDKILAERRRMQGVTVYENRCLVLALASMAVTAPYQFNIHQVVLGEVMGVVKWLKGLHMKPSTESSKLPRDILVNIKHLKFELTDDPFEVKLRDNYELKEDEYLESQKRMKVLEQKIEELRRKNLMFPKEKIEELLSNLNKKNAEIYVQRAKKLLVSVEPRTRLLECSIRGLEVMVLSDPSMQGRENVVSMMRSCDPDSPWPQDSSMQFSTLWCKWVKLETMSITFNLRDFPQNLLDISTLALWGKLAGAEVKPGKRAFRTHMVSVEEPFHDIAIERSLTPLKLYYDLACDVETLCMAYGSCWEPAVTQCSIALAYLTGTSLDPSPPLPWWDKTRLMLHGRVLLAARSTQLLLHASLDPYNTTEEMAVGFTDLELEWEEAMVKVRGTLDVYVRTASKYDDGHLLNMPGVNLTVKMEWVCLANPLDHHSVMPCAPDKLPEYSSNQEHDSYRAFRSNHLNISVSMETKGGRGVTKGERPKVDMFSSTLRWFENLKFIFSGASRPIRRGAQFLNKRPKKPNFSRHFKRVGLSVSLHQFQVNYWTSFSQQRGILLNVARGINLSTEHVLNLLPYKDGLRRRSRADWSVSFINSELATSDIWIQSAVSTDPAQETPPSSPIGDSPVPPTPSSRDTLGSRSEFSRNMERSFFFCVEKVVYMRMGQGLSEEVGKPTHKLVIHGARGAWTQSNRDMWFALYDSWRRAQILRKNVSSDALKSFHGDCVNNHTTGSEKTQTPFTSPTPHNTQQNCSPFSWSLGNARSGLSMMDRLLLETEGGATPTAYSEDRSGEEEVKHSLEAMAACSMDDILHRNWCIELVNSQVLLKGIETKGYVIISAARATVSQNICRPVWKEKTLLSKTTWSGGLETMQYYATVSEEGADLDNIMWLTVDNIGEGEEQHRLPGPAGLVGSGKAVGGVVSQVVGVTDSPGDQGIQLQRIVSRCKAEFFYVSYGDTELESVEGKQGGTSGSEVGWTETETAVNAFSFVHHDLNASTNSLQYAMLLDIANNLLLYTEPSIKERTDRYLRMRYLFMLEIDNIDDQRKRIIKGQNQLRQLVCKLRQSEKDMYMLQCGVGGHERNKGERKARLEQEAVELKDKLNLASEDLDMRIRCYRETQMSFSQRNSAIRREDSQAKLRRRAEICFSKAVWRLTEIDGQLGIADLNISNFLFTRSSMSDDSVENLLEMGYVHVKNLLPNQVYYDVLTPTELRDMPLDRQRTVRIFARDRPKVGGILVRDHFEINIAPLTINITAHFYKKMMNFAFPEKDAEHLEEDYDMDKKSKKKSKKNRNASTSFYVACPNNDKDDVEKMKERAEKNKLFIYIKIPEVPIKVSYKGEKEKNQILDVADFHLQVPTLEYHNVTWTWLDLLLAVKSRTRESLLAQAFKQKFLRKGTKTEDHQETSEEEKAQLLLGKQVGNQPGGSVRTSRRFLPLRK